MSSLYPVLIGANYFVLHLILYYHKATFVDVICDSNSTYHLKNLHHSLVLKIKPSAGVMSIS